MIKSRGSARRGRRLAVVVALATTCGAVFLGSAGPASAGNLIVCGGKIQPANKKKPGADGRYFIQCSEDIKGYAVVGNQLFDFFGTETDVVPTTSQSATLQCEGTVPGSGFGCGVVDRTKAVNVVSAGNVISGDISFSQSPCKTKGRLKAWVIASSEPTVTSFSPTGDKSTIGHYASQPFQLSTKGWSAKKCAKVNEKK